MAERSIADYQPPRDKPQLTFLTPRFDAEQLPLNVYAIGQKKLQDQQKAEAVIHYAQHEQQCRTILLLNYFNERDGQPCGQCDVCLRRRKATSPEQNVEADLEQRLLLRLQQGPLSPRALSKAFEQVPETQVVAALRQLVEQERVRYDDRGHIILNPHLQA